MASSSDTENEAGPSEVKKARLSGAHKYKTKFCKEWTKEWSFIIAVPENKFSFKCTLCSKTLSCCHMGIADVKSHISGKNHQRIASQMARMPQLSFSRADPLSEKIIRAEVKFTNFVVEHNLPLSVTDHLTPLIRDAFSDSQIAKKYASRRTKATSVLNLAIASHFRNSLIENMKKRPFSMSVDGSNNTGLEKLNPLTVRIYDVSRRQVSTQLLDMCTTTGRESGTASTIFNKIDSVLTSLNIPRENCVGFGVDNTSVNIGRHHSIKTLVLERVGSCYFMGCPCHLIHSIASHASKALHVVSHIDIEDICVDVFYWFDKSTKRKGVLNEFCEFCDSSYHEVIRYISVRWLSLEQAVHRILLLYQSLQSYFRSEEENQPRFTRLFQFFDDPMSEVYLLFYESIFPVFTRLNLLLQQEYPTIFLVADEIRAFLKKLLSKFVTVRAIRQAEDVTDIDFNNVSNQLSDTNITIGIVTKQTMNRLLEEGDIGEAQKKTFYKAVRAFYMDVVSQALQKLPFTDEVLNNCKFVNFEAKDDCVFSSVEYFCGRYLNILNFSSSDLDRVQEEFLDYQLLTKRDIPQTVWDESAITINDDGVVYHRMDMIWGHLSTICNNDGTKRFERLFKVANIILSIPHSNAGEERVFNLIKLNKTPTRSALDLNGTLSSIVTVKLANNNDCHSWEPSKELLKISKRATTQYNSLHSNK